MPVISTPLLTLLAPETAFVLTAPGGPGSTASNATVDVEDRIEAYNGMILPVDSVLQLPPGTAPPPVPAPQPVGGVEPAMGPAGAAAPQPEPFITQPVVITLPMQNATVAQALPGTGAANASAASSGPNY